MIPKISQFNSKVNNWGYFIIEAIRLKFTRRKKLNILFSQKPAWERNIRLGFKFTRQEIQFNKFTPENIKNSDLVVPLTISDIILLNEDRSLVKNNLIPIPRLEAVRLCDDKYQFYQVLKEKGFEYAMPKIAASLPYPYILKKKWGEDGEGCYIISDAEKEKQYQDLISDKDFFCQELIQGRDEYATHILFKDNKIQASITLKYSWSQSTAIKGQDKFLTRTIVRCPYLDLFSEILESIDLQGLSCLNYKLKDGKPYIFEINPRFGGSLSMFFFSFIRHLDKTKGYKPSYTQTATNAVMRDAE